MMLGRLGVLNAFQLRTSSIYDGFIRAQPHQSWEAICLCVCAYVCAHVRVCVIHCYVENGLKEKEYDFLQHLQSVRGHAMSSILSAALDNPVQGYTNILQSPPYRQGNWVSERKSYLSKVSDLPLSQCSFLCTINVRKNATKDSQDPRSLRATV